MRLRIPTNWVELEDRRASAHGSLLCRDVGRAGRYNTLPGRLHFTCSEQVLYDDGDAEEMPTSLHGL
jgi:hypothetical protein